MIFNTLVNLFLLNRIRQGTTYRSDYQRNYSLNKEQYQSLFDSNRHKRLKSETELTQAYIDYQLALSNRNTDNDSTATSSLGRFADTLSEHVSEDLDVVSSAFSVVKYGLIDSYTSAVTDISDYATDAYLQLKSSGQSFRDFGSRILGGISNVFIDVTNAFQEGFNEKSNATSA